MTSHRYDADDIETHPVVVELRRALAVQRTALEMQAGTIASIHSDGDAKTRGGDHGPALRRSVDFFLPLLVGIIIGALGVYSGIAGRMAKSETEIAALNVSRDENARRWEKLDTKMDDFAQKLSDILAQLNKPRTR